MIRPPRAGSVFTGRVNETNDDATADLVARWVAGWALSRGMAYDAMEPLGRSWLAHVGSELRTREFVVVRPTVDELDAVVRAAGRQPGSWLSVVGEQDPALAARLAPLERVTHDELVMTLPIARRADSAVTPADGLAIRETESDAAAGEGVVGHATVTIDGQTAASGRAAVRGADVVVDRIGTVPEFRRRGLGRTVTQGLTSWAATRGASTGILVASSQGRHLYAALGWHEAAPVATYAVDTMTG